MKNLTRKPGFIAGIIITTMVMVACANPNDKLTKEVVYVPPPLPVKYREPTYVGISKTNTNLQADEDASFTRFLDPVIIKKYQKEIITFYICYENTRNYSDLKANLPKISSSENLNIIDTEIDESITSIFYSCLVSMTNYGIAFLECTAGEHSRRIYVYCPAEVLNDGKWIGTGIRLTEFETPVYTVNSAGAKSTTILYLYGAQAKTNYDFSHINAYVNNIEEPVDSLAFPSTSSYGDYQINQPHIFSFESGYKMSTIKFRGKSGDFSCYLGFVFSWPND